MSRPPSVDVRRGADRYRTQTDWLDTRHSFSSGRHYDPTNTSFGPLVVHDVHAVAPGAGFEPHPHRDVEVVSWVLQGALAHEDSAGTAGLLRPGQVQRMSAGSGVVHSERSAATEPLVVVQAWVLPDEVGAAPSYATRDVDLTSAELVPVASGDRRHDAAVRLGHRGAALHVARLPVGRAVHLPEAPLLHVLLARGTAELEGTGRLDPGDAVRLAASGGQRLTAADDVEVLVWELPDAAR